MDSWAIASMISKSTGSDLESTFHEVSRSRMLENRDASGRLEMLHAL
jgi:hypothetical protein